MKRIAVISDSHDHLMKLKKACDRIMEEKADLIIHLGDFIAPFCMPIIQKTGIPFIGVFGNNDGEKGGLGMKVKGWGEIFDPPHVLEIEGRNILLSHSPLPMELIKRSYPETEIFLHGHTHEICDKTLNNIRILNPGEICGYLSGKSTLMILELPECKTELIEIE